MSAVCPPFITVSTACGTVVVYHSFGKVSTDHMFLLTRTSTITPDRARLSLPPRGDVMQLRWAVVAVAQRKGVGDHKALAALAELDVQTAAGLWGVRQVKGATYFSKFVEVETIRKVCLALDARPPGVFAWLDESVLEWHRTDQDGPPYLVWRVRELAERRGLTRIQFARAAQMFYARKPDSVPSMAERIWAGEHRAIALTTLASVCSVLRVSPGDLFVPA